MYVCMDGCMFVWMDVCGALQASAFVKAVGAMETSAKEKRFPDSAEGLATLGIGVYAPALAQSLQLPGLQQLIRKDNFTAADVDRCLTGTNAPRLVRGAVAVPDVKYLRRVHGTRTLPVAWRVMSCTAAVCFLLRLANVVL